MAEARCAVDFPRKDRYLQAMSCELFDANRLNATNAMDATRCPSSMQVRVQALNDDLHTLFQRWYPALGHRREEKIAA